MGVTVAGVESVAEEVRDPDVFLTVVTADVVLVLASVIETSVLVLLIGPDAVGVVVIRTPNGPSVDVVTVSKKGHAKVIVVKGKDDVVLMFVSAGEICVEVVLLVVRV